MSTKKNQEPQSQPDPWCGFVPLDIIVMTRQNQANTSVQMLQVRHPESGLVSMVQVSQQNHRNNVGSALAEALQDLRRRLDA